MNLVRKYKISKLTNKPLTGIDNEIVSFIKGWLSDLIPFMCLEYPNTTFYMRPTGEWVLGDNGEPDFFFVRYDKFWFYLKINFNLENPEVIEYLKYFISECFNRKITHIDVDGFGSNWYVEEVYQDYMRRPFISKNNIQIYKKEIEQYCKNKGHELAKEV